MFFSDNIPLSFVSFMICFLLRNFWRDFFKLLASNVDTLLPSDGFSILGADCPFFPSGSLLKFPLSEPYFWGFSTGLPGSFSSYPVGTWAGPTDLSLLLPYNEAKSWGVP